MTTYKPRHRATDSHRLDPQSAAGHAMPAAGDAPSVHAEGGDTVPVERAEVDQTDLAQKARGGVVWLGLANVVAKGAQVVLTLMMARLLSTTELGRFSLAMTLLTYASLLQSMGMYDVVNRTRKDPLAFSGTMASISLVAGVLLGLILGVFAPQWAGAMGDEGLTSSIRLAALVLPLMAYTGIQTALLTRRLDFRTRVLCDGGSALVGTAVSVGLMFLGYGAPGALAGVLVTYIASPLIAMLAGLRIRPRWQADDAREAWAWTRVAGPGAVLGVMMFTLDYVVIGRTLGSSATGVYGLGYRFAFMPYVALAMVLAGVAFPIFAHLVRESTQAMDEAVVKYSAVMAGVLVGLYAVLAVIAPFLVVLGDQWADAVTPLRILCVYGALLSLALIPQDALRAAGLKRSYLLLQVIHFASLLTLLIVLTRTHGINGAASAQALCAAIACMAGYGLLARGTGVRIRAIVMEVAAPVMVGLCVAVAGVWLLHATSIPARSVPWLVGTGLLAGVAYAGLLALVRPSLTRMIMRQLLRRG